MSVPDVFDAPLTVAAVASRLGVAASTLRTWDRRYGLGPSSHEAGAHRRYTPADVARLERMRSLTLQGVAPSDAASIALSESPDEPLDVIPEPPARKLALVGDPELLADPLTLVAAALEPDLPRTERIVVYAVERLGVLRAWAEVIRPALRILRNKTRADKPGIEPDAAIASALCVAVRHATPDQRPVSGEAVGILSAAPSTMHGQIIAAALRARGADVVLLRPASQDSADDVLALAKRHNVRAVVAVGDTELLSDIMTRVSESEDLVGFLVGRFACDLWLPRVHRVRTVPAAVEEVADLLAL